MSNFASGPLIRFYFNHAMQNTSKKSQKWSEALLYQQIRNVVYSYPCHSPRRVDYVEDIVEKIELATHVTNECLETRCHSFNAVNSISEGQVFNEQQNDLDDIIRAFESNWMSLPPDRVRRHVYRHYTLNASIQNATDSSLNALRFPEQWSKESIYHYTEWMHHNDLKTYASDTLKQMEICELNKNIQCVEKLKEIVAAHPCLVKLKTSELLISFLENQCNKPVLLLIYISVPAWQTITGPILYKHSAWYLSSLRDSAIPRLFAQYSNDNDLQLHWQNAQSASSASLKSNQKFLSKRRKLRLLISKASTNEEVANVLNNETAKSCVNFSTSLDTFPTMPILYEANTDASGNTLNVFSFTVSNDEKDQFGTPESIPYTPGGQNANFMYTAHENDTSSKIQIDSSSKFGPEQNKRKGPPITCFAIESETCTSTHSTKRLKQMGEEAILEDDQYILVTNGRENQTKWSIDLDPDDNICIEITDTKMREPRTVDNNDIRTATSSEEEYEIEIVPDEE